MTNEHSAFHIVATTVMPHLVFLSNGSRTSRQKCARNANKLRENIWCLQAAHCFKCSTFLYTAELSFHSSLGHNWINLTKKKKKYSNFAGCLLSIEYCCRTASNSTTWIHISPRLRSLEAVLQVRVCYTEYYRFVCVLKVFLTVILITK